MRRIPILLGTLLAVLLVAASSATAQSKPLRGFILAGQSNMQGHAKVETFDYIGDDPATAPLLRQMRGADGKMTDQQKREYLQNFEAKLISPAEAALWKRGASNAGYHYLGCAKTFALMGRAFAEATLTMMKD